MSTLPSTDKTEVFVMRISKAMKKKLENIAKSKKSNSSEVIRSLIESESKKITY